MINKLLILIAVTVTFVNIPAYAQTRDVTITRQWARASIGTMRPTAAYLTITNNGKDAVILDRIKTKIAAMAHIHNSTTNAKGISSMAPAGEIRIEPNQSVTLQPSGLHIMLMDLQRPLIKGDSFELTLIFKNGQHITTDVPVLAISARGPKE